MKFLYVLIIWTSYFQISIPGLSDSIPFTLTNKSIFVLWCFESFVCFERSASTVVERSAPTRRVLYDEQVYGHSIEILIFSFHQHNILENSDHKNWNISKTHLWSKKLLQVPSLGLWLGPLQPHEMSPLNSAQMPTQIHL